MNKARRVALMVIVLLALALGASGCGSGYEGQDSVPSGGVDATNGKVILDDVWIDGPSGLPAGADTGLRLDLANDSYHRDALTGVSVPLAHHARLILHGRPVRRIPVGAWGDRDLEWRSNRDGVELVGLKRAVKPGQWFDATFRFEHSRPVTMQVTVAPLAREVRPPSIASSGGAAAARGLPG
jgi:copper(I)-binding protein